MKIALVGAYGYTGKLICKRLNDARITFDVFGRDQGKLNQLKDTYSFIEKASRVDIRLRSELQEIIQDHTIIINCAGPFTEEAQELLLHCAKNGEVYLDISGELEFIKNSFDTHDALAKTSGATIIHGCAFESAVVDLALCTIAKNKPIRSFRSTYFFNQHRVSPGTRMTMKLAKYRNNWHVQNGNWLINESSPFRVHPEVKHWNKTQGTSYPLPEVAFALWNHEVSDSSSNLAVDDTEAMFLKMAEAQAGSALDTLDKLRLRKVDGPSAEERASQRSEICIEINARTSDAVNYLLRSNDMYDLTAHVIVLAVQKIIGGVELRKGVISPRHLFPDECEETLSILGVEMQELMQVND